MIRLIDTVMLSRVDDEIVLLDGASGKYFGLNPVGSRLVELLLESPDDEAALRRAISEYEAPEELIRTDFKSLVGNLRSRGLIHEEA